MNHKNTESQNLQKTPGIQSGRVINLGSFTKLLANLRIIMHVFFHFLPLLLRGKISPRRYVAFSIRLLVFLKAVQHNKFYRNGKNIKLDLYVPEYPSRAFFYACEKFRVFDDRMPPITVLLSVTSACRFRCKHCYQGKDHGKDVDIDVLVATVKKLQNNGIAFFNIEGGEPFLVFDRLKKVLEAIDDRSEIWVNSTGDHMTLDKLQELKNLNVKAIMFSMHSPDPAELNQFMGRDDAWETMVNGIALCREAGILPTVNSCLLKEDFMNGKFERLMERCKELGVALIQLIVPKPSGAWLQENSLAFSAVDRQILEEKVLAYNLDLHYKDYPAISAQAIEESPEHFGCTAGGTDRFYINAKGDLQPCEFLNISFGNIANDDFDTIYSAMRKRFCNPGECWLCEAKAREISRLYAEHKLRCLPLSPELSRQIYEELVPGRPTRFYLRLEKLGK